MNKEQLIRLGSHTAKAGFQNEKDVVDAFNNWQTDVLAKQWLMVMGYNLDEIEYVIAEIIHGQFKADIQVQITIKLTHLIDSQNIQVKLVSNKTGFNQIDKRRLEKYQEMWDMPHDILEILQYYTGELPPYKKNTKDPRRMFLTEMSEKPVSRLIDWINNNKPLIITDVLKGRGKFSAEWVLVIQKSNELNWVLLPINIVINHYSAGATIVTKQGNLKMGKITIQRKGGDNGRESAKMLQFKLDPIELFVFKTDSETA